MIVYAHRGARGYAPENTMAAFKLAQKMKADGIELDVQLTADKQVVICHDHDIGRTSNGRGRIGELTLRQLKQFDFGSWFGEQYRGETIPTLEAFLLWFNDTGMLLNIEIKNGPIVYRGIEEQVADAVIRHQLQERVVISSFYHPSLLRIKQMQPSLQTAALFDCRPINPLSFAEELGCDYLHPHWTMVDGEWVGAARARGVKVNAYTVNSIDEYRFIKDVGIDGIFCDFPDRFIQPNL